MSAKKKGKQVSGQRRRLEIEQYILSLAAKGLSKSQSRSVAAAYSEEVCSSPLKDIDLEESVKRAWRQWKSEKSVFHFKDLHNVETVPIEFLQKPYFPRGSVSIIDGDPGNGKSFVTMALTAAVTTGGTFAAGSPLKKGKVLLLSPEDEPDKILRPRLEAHGANIKLVRFMDIPILLDESGTSILRAEIANTSPDLVVIDPMSAFLPPSLDMFRANEARGFMTPISQIAKERNIAIVLVRHLRKASTENALQRGQGSMDFIAAVRSALVVVKHPKDPNLRVLSHMKHNYTKPGPSLVFEIEQESKKIGPKLFWRGEIEQSADELMQSGTEKKSLVDRAAESIEDMLKHGPVEAKIVKSRLNEAGYADRTIDRAKTILAVNSSRGPGAKWSLPKKSAKRTRK